MAYSRMREFLSRRSAWAFSNAFPGPSGFVVKSLVRTENEEV
jgi:hypothetical protein